MLSSLSLAILILIATYNAQQPSISTTGGCDGPKICTLNYSPVCCNGETYGNQCNAESKCVWDVLLCTEGECTGSPATTDDCNGMKACTREYRPVCCDEGKTYSNQCVADSFCAINCVAGECTATTAEQRCDGRKKCSKIYKPVCCDGNNYGNQCVADSFCSINCQNGECPKEPQNTKDRRRSKGSKGSKGSKRSRNSKDKHGDSADHRDRDGDNDDDDVEVDESDDDTVEQNSAFQNGGYDGDEGHEGNNESGMVSNVYIIIIGVIGVLLVILVLLECYCKRFKKQKHGHIVVGDEEEEEDDIDVIEGCDNTKTTNHENDTLNIETR